MKIFKKISLTIIVAFAFFTGGNVFAAVPMDAIGSERQKENILLKDMRFALQVLGQLHQFLVTKKGIILEEGSFDSLQLSNQLKRLEEFDMKVHHEAVSKIRVLFDGRQNNAEFQELVGGLLLVWLDLFTEEFMPLIEMACTHSCLYLVRDNVFELSRALGYLDCIKLQRHKGLAQVAHKKVVSAKIGDAYADVSFFDSKKIGDLIAKLTKTQERIRRFCEQLSTSFRGGRLTDGSWDVSAIEALFKDDLDREKSTVQQETGGKLRSEKGRKKSFSGDGFDTSKHFQVEAPKANASGDSGDESLREDDPVLLELYRSQYNLSAAATWDDVRKAKRCDDEQLKKIEKACSADAKSKKRNAWFEQNKKQRAMRIKIENEQKLQDAKEAAREDALKKFVQEQELKQAAQEQALIEAVMQSSLNDQ